MRKTPSAQAGLLFPTPQPIHFDSEVRALLVEMAALESQCSGGGRHVIFVPVQFRADRLAELRQ